VDRIGRYKIVRELGRGAMGVVYHALDPNIGRPVAIKTIRIGDARKPEEQQRLRERLLREARSAGSLSHPGIVTIYDVEQQGDLAYIAMEYVDGPTLDHLISRGTPMAPAQIFSILGQTAAALDYAHQKGIVHRDIKPANIMIAADGTTKITDFGIAKITATDQFTMTGTIVGTPHYMSPEQVQGQPVDGRADQFSLAVIAYEILTGEKPYTGEHLTTVVYKIVAEEPVAPHRLNPTLAGAIENALRKGLSKKPDGRYRTCQEFTEALERACAANKAWKPVARGASSSAATVVEAPAAEPRSAPKLPPAHNPRSTQTIDERESKSGFVPWLVAILMVTGLLAGMATVNGSWLRGSWGQKLSGMVDRARSLVQPKQTAASPAVPTQVPAQTAPPPTAPSGPAVEDKPSPMPSPSKSAPSTDAPAAAVKPPPVSQTTQDTDLRPQKAKAAAPPVESPARVVRHAVTRAAAVPQEVMVISSPAGATATLDGQSTEACATPCKLAALPGPHEIAITMPGYEIDRQQVDIGTAPPSEVQVVLRALGGTLYLNSDPPGAAITINGRRYSQLTPAQFALTPGTYTVTLEKNGKQVTQSVVVQNGRLNFLKIPLE
jgi:serine/threonine protein kinase